MEQKNTFRKKNTLNVGKILFSSQLQENCYILFYSTFVI